MKLVGATKSFIRAPFLVQAVFQGLFSALLAIVMLVGILFFVRNEFEQLFEVFRLDLLLMVMGSWCWRGLSSAWSARLLLSDTWCPSRRMNCIANQNIHEYV